MALRENFFLRIFRIYFSALLPFLDDGVQVLCLTGLAL
jgi:hypothetical protein